MANTSLQATVSTTTAAANSNARNSGAVFSVFDVVSSSRGYISTSKSANGALSQLVYFTVEKEASGSITGISRAAVSISNAFKPSGKQAESQENNDTGFWKLIVTDLQEQHTEKMHLHNTLSDGSSVFATGAHAVKVVISGKLLVSATDDHEYEFLSNYVSKFRARQLSADESILKFVCKDSTFALHIEKITLGASIEEETYVNMSVQGTAFNYRMLGSRETLNFGYYGTAAKLATLPARATILDSNTDVVQDNKPGGVITSNKMPETTAAATVSTASTVQTAATSTVPTAPDKNNNNPTIEHVDIGLWG